MEKCEWMKEWGEGKERQKEEGRVGGRRKGWQERKMEDTKPGGKKFQQRMQECKDKDRALALWLLGSCWLCPLGGKVDRPPAGPWSLSAADSSRASSSWQPLPPAPWFLSS